MILLKYMGISAFVVLLLFIGITITIMIGHSVKLIYRKFLNKFTMFDKNEETKL